MTETQRNDPALFKAPLPFPSAGAYGCAVSHLRLWERAMESGQAVTVAEDDAIFRHDFRSRSAEVLAQVSSGWDFVLWGWNFDSILSVSPMPGVSRVVMLFDQSELRAGLETFQRTAGASFALPLDKCFGIPAYTISPEGARRFREHCFPMANFQVYFPGLNKNIENTGVDIAMNRIYPATRSFVAFPPLVATMNDRARSTIQPEPARSWSSARRW
jgi:GR25 family glycosyltransferase involved in LPS biosynthesis